MEKQSLNNRRKGFLVFRGVLRILLGALLFILFLGGLDDGADPQIELSALDAGLLAIFCLGYSLWFLYSGFRLVQVGLRTTNGAAGPGSWPESGLGPLDTGILMLGIALSLVTATVASILDGAYEYQSAPESASAFLGGVSILVGAVALLWFGVKSARMSRSGMGQTELEMRRNLRSPGRFLVLSVCSYFAYTTYWIYRNWEDIKRADSSHINPFWRTVGTFIPFLGLVMVYKQLRDIYRLAESGSIQPRHSLSLISVCYLVPGLISHLLLVWGIFSWDASQSPSLAFDLSIFLLGLVWLLPLLSVQETINRTWQTSLPHPSGQKSLSAAETIWVFVGALLLVSTVVPHVWAI